jgi:hypothetical protein
MFFFFEAPGAPPPLCRSPSIVPGGDAFYPVNLKRQEGEGGRWSRRALPAEGSIRTAADGGLCALQRDKPPMRMVNPQGTPSKSKTTRRGRGKVDRVGLAGGEESIHTAGCWCWLMASAERKPPMVDPQVVDFTGWGLSLHILAGACSRAAPTGLPLERDATQWLNTM